MRFGQKEWGPSYYHPKKVFYGVLSAEHRCSRYVLPSLFKGMTRTQFPVLIDMGQL